MISGKINRMFERGGLIVFDSERGIDITRAEGLSEAAIVERASSAVCFNVGDLSKICDFHVIPDLLRLPFPMCWFEMLEYSEQSISRWGALAFERDGDRRISIITFMFDEGDETHLPPAWIWVGMAAIGTGGDCLESYVPEGANLEGAARCVAQNVAKFLSALNCSNVSRVEHAPPEKLQKARVKRGKRPIFSYWTLSLSLSDQTGVRSDLGGTHASPRVHLRRGHPRQYAPGQWTWVQPHAVGNKSLGMVHKDYRAKP